MWTVIDKIKTKHENMPYLIIVFPYTIKVGTFLLF